MKTLTFALSLVAALGLSACSTPAPAPAPSMSASAPFDATTNYEGSSASSSIGEIPTSEKQEVPKKKEVLEVEASAPSVPFVQFINGVPVIEIPKGATAPTKLHLTVLKKGTGKEITSLDTEVIVQYRIVKWDGKDLDNSYKSGNPVTLSLGSLIDGMADGLMGQKVGSTVLLLIPADMAYGAIPGHELENTALAAVVEIVGTEDREPVKTTAKTAGKALSEPDHVAKVEGDVTPQIEKTTPLLKAEKTSVTLVGETEIEPSPVTTVPIEPEAPVNGPLLPPRITMGTTYGSIIFDAERSGPVFVSWHGSTTDQEAFTVVCPPELRGASLIGCVQSDGSKWQWMPAADVSTWALQTFGGGNRV